MTLKAIAPKLYVVLLSRFISHGKKNLTMIGGIFIALGANLPSVYGEPYDTLETVIQIFVSDNIKIMKRSSWWRSAPMPASDQPDFINGVVEVDTVLSPQNLLQYLHHTETIFGRIRQQRWEARTLDLDLIDYRGAISRAESADGPILPHPRLQDRLFVLLPLQEIAPAWRHPMNGKGLSNLLEQAESININKL